MWLSKLFTFIISIENVVGREQKLCEILRMEIFTTQDKTNPRKVNIGE
jgi:hypothetical protein